MFLRADLKDFVHNHRPHGTLTALPVAVVSPLSAESRPRMPSSIYCGWQDSTDTCG